MAATYRGVRDITAGAMVATHARVASNYWMRFRGLMMRKQLSAGEGLIIEPCGSIHMMFMRFSIDAVFFNRAGVVTNVGRKMRPWTGIAIGKHGVYGVIELPAGVAVDVQAGHQLEFVDVPAETR